MKNNILFLIGLTIALLILASGCMHKATEQGYAEYLNDPENKIVQHITIGEVTTTAKWMPDMYRKLMNRTATANSEKGDDDRYYYFDVKFNKKTGDKPDKNKIMYLAFDMEKDFVLVINKDSVAPAICQKIENGIGGSYEYMLAFEKNEINREEEGFTLIYEDKIFGIGTIAFAYKPEDIKRIPLFKNDIIQ